MGLLLAAIGEMGEIGGHGRVTRFHRAGERGEYLPLEFPWAHASEIRAAEHPAIGREDVGREGGEVAIVMLHFKNLALFIP